MRLLKRSFLVMVTFCVVACAGGQSVFAFDELLQNGDFTESVGHWERRGEGNWAVYDHDPAYPSGSFLDREGGNNGERSTLQNVPLSDALTDGHLLVHGKVCERSGEGRITLTVWLFPVEGNPFNWSKSVVLHESAGWTTLTIDEVYHGAPIQELRFEVYYYNVSGGTLHGIAKASLQLERFPSETIAWMNGARERYGDGFTVPIQGAVERFGHLPEGKAYHYHWKEGVHSVLLQIGVNAGDPYGVAITGVRRGDRIEILGASGIASFGNGVSKKVSSVIFVAAEVATGIAGEESRPVIDGIAAGVLELYGAWKDNLQRDAAGRNPINGDWNRQEGGLIICMPPASTVYYSGESGNLWVKGSDSDGPRRDNRRPDHVRHGFFFIPDEPSHNVRDAEQDGIIYIAAWDFDFDDNQGGYAVILRLTRGS